MPNWCENRVTISFDVIEDKKLFINRCLTEAEDEPGTYFLDFHKIRPLGLGEDENGDPKWDYNVAVDLWGTKWEIGDTVVDQVWVEDDEDLWLQMYFETAWSPPEGIYNELNAMFDDAHISWFYDEPGMEFAGYLNNE
tara:strand:+ start:823 stop:1236 length:414 start_codon:yes stop_codon:yes gene_type:complete